MDQKKNLFSSAADELQNDEQLLSEFSSQQQCQKWEEPSPLVDYGMKQFSGQPSDQINFLSQQGPKMNEIPQDTIKVAGWDPRMMLNNLSFMEQKIHQLQDLVHLIVGRKADRPGDLVAQQQQLITADLTSIIVQLISTAGSLLPSVNLNISNIPSSVSPSAGQLGGVTIPCAAGLNGDSNNNVNKVEDWSDIEADHGVRNYGTEHMDMIEEHDMKDEDDVEEGENLPPGSYEILQLEKEEILAPHTHFCVICGKGFKRDANLRMHMRGHGDEYKTPAALAKPHKDSSSEPKLIKRYSCPYAGCKRNKDHKKFQPLKTILCVKNHYRRTHCDKSYTCSRCNTKRFSVIADLKTHEKHCGRDKWLCSCGTTFSRKDKLFGHIALFQGHTPAIPLDDETNKGLIGDGEAPSKIARLDFKSSTPMDVKGGGGVDQPNAYFLPSNSDTCNLNGFHQEFPRNLFEETGSSLSFLISGSCNYPWKNGGESSSKDSQ